MLSNNFKNHLVLEIERLFSLNVADIAFNPVFGGSINHCFKISLPNLNLFLKVNDNQKYPKMFETEYKGMKVLSNSSSFNIPTMHLYGAFQNSGFLVMEYIEEESRSDAFWKTFGHQLAQLHQSTTTEFGLDHQNYIGSLSQGNNFHKKWSDFFISERLNPMIEIARNQNAIQLATIKQFEDLYKKLDDIFPVEPPALIHGDLWNGNFMTDSSGQATIFDPAIYYGHREMDIAMSKLFGGFDQLFYDSYNETFPLTHDWEARVDVANLYPLLVHVNLFGGGYIHQVKSILSRFVG